MKLLSIKRIYRGADIDVGIDDTGLLKRQTGLQDGGLLGVPDGGVGQFGPFKLAGGDLFGQLGGGGDGRLQLTGVGQGIGPRLLVGVDDFADQFGMILGEVLAGVQDAPAIGSGLR